MKTTKILTILLFLFSGNMSAQKPDVLISISGHEISKAEFERIYKKNNQVITEESEIKTPREYLDMYINFKLKVIEAMSLNMDTAKSFKEELAGFRSELAAPYLTDMKYDERMVEEVYNRMKKEINASHILFRITNNAGSAQEEAALQKAFNVKQEILDGKDFNEAAYEYSEDPSAKSNKGNLGFFTAFQMVTPFENMAFNTPESQVSEPVRTSFGYHLIKVHEVRENSGEIKVAHIMKMFPRDEEFDKAALKVEMDTIYQKLLRGISFEELVKQHSDDKRSAAERGEMPWFSAGRMIPEFSVPAFALEKIGDFTQPVETSFGIHIIKKIGHRPVPPFEQVRADIEERIKKDPQRSSSTRNVFVEKLKQQYGFTESEESIRKLKHTAAAKEMNENPLLFSFDSKEFYLDDLTEYLSNENKGSGLLADHYDAWTEHEIIQMEDSRLEEKYPDFRYLMQEYHDGLLFFNIMEDKIWKFAAEDSVGLEKFYAANKDKFLWEERFKGMIITSVDAEAREEAEKYLEAGLSPEEVEDLMNKDGKRVEIISGAWEQDSSPAVDYFIWNGAVMAGFDPELTFVRGNVVAPEPKSLNEAKGLFISAYQDYLEKNWIKSLRKKHKIKVKKRVLKTVAHV